MIEEFNQVILKFPWDHWKKVPTRLGVRLVRKCPIPHPSEEFWLSWRANRSALKRAGYSVTSFNDQWTLIESKQAEEEQEPVTIEQEASFFNAVPQDIELPASIEEKLLSYQPDSVKRLIAAMRKYNMAVDGSDMGTGKSFVAAAMCKYFNWRPAILAPKAVLTAWYRCCKFMGVEPIMIQNYENVRYGNTPYGGWKIKDIHRKDGTIEKRFTFTWFGIPKENTVFILDEIQNCKNPTAKNTKMGLAAVREGYKVLGCSGTIAENPTEMRLSGHLAGLHKGADFFHWMMANGVVRGGGGRFFYKGGKAILNGICRKMYPEHGTRLRKIDLPDFPDCDIKAEAYDCGGNTKKIETVYADMYANIAMIEESSDSRQQKAILTNAERMRARQDAEMLKVPALVEMAKNAIENNLSVAIFTNFKATLYKLAEALKTKCVIHGDQAGKSGARERQQCIDDFQADRERIIIVNIKSGGAGIGLHDTHGKYARIAYICPTWSVFELDQSTGRIHRAGAKTKAIERVFYAAGTIEEEICDRVRIKLANMNSLRDADLAPAGVF